MDTALVLKKELDQQRITTFVEAKAYLDQSLLFSRLLEEFEPTSLNLLHRLLELIEIPFAAQYIQVQKWRNQLANLTFTGEGFSLSGKSDDILVCYNAMITYVLIQLNYTNLERVKLGIQWIVKYQNVERDSICLWSGNAIKKYGGCMKSTPCYIGLVKSMLVLSLVKDNEQFDELSVNTKLSKGLDYILNHHVYLKKSNLKPITSYIDKLTFPFTYKTNILEILRLLKANNRINDKRCTEALNLLLKKRKKKGFWQINSIPQPKHWVMFDPIKEKGEWVTYTAESILANS